MDAEPVLPAVGDAVVVADRHAGVMVALVAARARGRREGEDEKRERNRDEERESSHVDLNTASEPRSQA